MEPTPNNPATTRTLSKAWTDHSLTEALQYLHAKMTGIHSGLWTSRFKGNATRQIAEKTWIDLFKVYEKHEVRAAIEFFSHGSNKPPTPYDFAMWINEARETERRRQPTHKALSVKRDKEKAAKWIKELRSKITTDEDQNDDKPEK